MEIVEQTLEETDAYSLFLYAFRSPVTKDCYLRRMKIFFNFIKKINTEYRIMIPRLVILEIEYQYNRNKKDNKKENSNSENNRKNIRDAYSDMVEVFSCQFLPISDNEKITTSRL